jgi:AbrB family looped-hinge helix DNA binding protein
MAWYYSNMVNRITIDGAGRVVIPKGVREELQLSAGDSLELEAFEDQIVLRPARSASALVKKQGIWIHRSSEAVPENVIQDTIDRLHNERIAELTP